ncbi:hypothetical protein T484DRAFT_1907087, partial [Baffinella frigidus]
MAGWKLPVVVALAAACIGTSSPSTLDSSSSSSTFRSTSGLVLGFPDERLLATSPHASKLGGLPLWNAPPPPIGNGVMPCPECSKPMPFFMTVAAPLADPDCDRAFYIFACPEARCSLSTRSCRALPPQAPPPHATPAPPPAAG